MGILWGLVVVALSLLCWGGQVISWFAPATAVRLTLMEAEDSVEPTYFADVRGEALWDTLTLWTLVVAGVLLTLDVSAWAYFGLVGGGIWRALERHELVADPTPEEIEAADRWARAEAEGAAG